MSNLKVTLNGMDSSLPEAISIELPANHGGGRANTYLWVGSEETYVGMIDKKEDLIALKQMIEIVLENLETK